MRTHAEAIDGRFCAEKLIDRVFVQIAAGKNLDVAKMGAVEDLPRLPREIQKIARI
jgi:hypothetical protein